MLTRVQSLTASDASVSFTRWFKKAVHIETTALVAITKASAACLDYEVYLDLFIGENPTGHAGPKTLTRLLATVIAISLSAILVDLICYFPVMGDLNSCVGGFARLILIQQDNQ